MFVPGELGINIGFLTWRQGTPCLMREPFRYMYVYLVHVSKKRIDLKGIIPIEQRCVSVTPSLNVASRILRPDCTGSMSPGYARTWAWGRGGFFFTEF